MGSGECAVLARKGTGITAACASIIPEACVHRISFAWVAGVAKGGLHLILVYLVHSVGPNETNLWLSEQVAIAIRTPNGPWVLAGDFNMPPDPLAQSGFLN